GGTAPHARVREPADPVVSHPGSVARRTPQRAGLRATRARSVQPPLARARLLAGRVAPRHRGRNPTGRRARQLARPARRPAPALCRAVRGPGRPGHGPPGRPLLRRRPLGALPTPGRLPALPGRLALPGPLPDRTTGLSPRERHARRGDPAK